MTQHQRAFHECWVCASLDPTYAQLLIALGFKHDRTSGSHRIYVHPEVTRPLSVQPRGKDAKPYQVRQLRVMIEEFGLKL